MFRHIFSREKKNDGPIYIVSGLPRSGTSMMMNMLAQGGLEIVTDALRQADEDNPNGYFEMETVKKLKDGQRDWLAGTPGKVVKVISHLLEYLPPQFDYEIIFMERAIAEILASQQKMLAHRGESSQVSDDVLEQQYREHLEVVKYWLARQANMRILFINYNEMLADPEPACRNLAHFLSRPLDLAAMLAVPNQSLYRNRIK